jgi:hypothetical protein
VLANYSKSEVKAGPVDTNNNRKADSLGLRLGGIQNTVIILDYFDDTRSKLPWRFGPGGIESILVKRPNAPTS